MRKYNIIQKEEVYKQNLKTFSNKTKNGKYANKIQMRQMQL